MRIRDLKETNPFYWNCRLEASKYSDEYGVMGGFGGYASDAHEAIAIALGDAGCIYPSDNQNGRYEFPVRKWQKEVRQLNNRIKHILKMVEKL